MNQRSRGSLPLTRHQTIAALAMLGLGLRSVSTFAHAAQDDPLAGATIEGLSAGSPTALPGQALVLLRVTMEPGTVIAPHSHPGPVALYVESGTFGSEFLQGSGTVTHASGKGTPAAPSGVTVGDDLQMSAGDSLFYDGAVHTMRNDGDDTLVLLVSALFGAEAPGFEWQESATPSADRHRLTA